MLVVNIVLTTQASPGNLQQLEDVIFGGSALADSNVVMSVKLASDSGQKVYIVLPRWYMIAMGMSVDCRCGFC